MKVSLDLSLCRGYLSSLPLPSDRWADIRGFRVPPPIVLAKLFEIVIVIIKK